MKKNILYFGLVALFSALMVACTPTEPTFNDASLVGLWQEEGTETYVRFTTERETDSIGSYQYGREWDEADDVFEDDLTPYGSGWFKWKLVRSTLHELILMENNGAEIPKTYTVIKLTDTELRYKDEYTTHSFLKVAEKTFDETDLLGLWQEDGTNKFVRFTTEKNDTGEYLYGRQWNESDGVVESDLTPYGNGWFEWKLVNNRLTKICLIDGGGANIPNVYIMNRLTETRLLYNDEYRKHHSFSKIVK